MHLYALRFTVHAYIHFWFVCIQVSLNCQHALHRWHIWKKRSCIETGICILCILNTKNTFAPQHIYSHLAFCIFIHQLCCAFKKLCVMSGLNYIVEYYCYRLLIAFNYETNYSTVKTITLSTAKNFLGKTKINFSFDVMDYGMPSEIKKTWGLSEPKDK